MPNYLHNALYSCSEVLDFLDTSIADGFQSSFGFITLRTESSIMSVFLPLQQPRTSLVSAIEARKSYGEREKLTPVKGERPAAKRGPATSELQSISPPPLAIEVTK